MIPIVDLLKYRYCEILIAALKIDKTAEAWKKNYYPANSSIHKSSLNYLKKSMSLLQVLSSSIPPTLLGNAQLLYTADWSTEPMEEITRVIIGMWFLQESAMRMNGLHESNSKLNIRSYPKAKNTDSDLILLCPRALCSGLSTSETLRRINHLRFMALSRSQVHTDILHISLCPFAESFFEYLWILQQFPESFFCIRKKI